MRGVCFTRWRVPDVDEIDGLPPAVALQQQRGSPTTRSSVGSVTTLSNLLRMLYSRAGDYPRNQPLLYAEAFSPNTPEGACPACHGLGRVYEVTERSMVPDDSLTIRERAIAAWPPAWHGQNLRDMLASLGYDVDRPWRELPKKDRDWILFTEEQPVVPVYAGYNRAEVRRAIKRKEEPELSWAILPSARRYVLHTFANTESASIKKRVAQYMVSTECPVCHGKRLAPGVAVGHVCGPRYRRHLPAAAEAVGDTLAPYADGTAPALSKLAVEHPEKAVVAQRIAEDLLARLAVLLDLGLGYLSLERSTPTLSPGELQRLRLATQVRSNLFGVVYVLDEPSAGLHPADTEALLRALDRLKASGNSLFVVEHELDVIRHADWIVDVGPAAGEQGGEVLYSGPPEGLRAGEGHRRPGVICLRATCSSRAGHRARRRAGCSLTGVTRNNLHDLDVDFPLGVFTTVTGVSGSGKSSLVSQVLVELVAEHLGHALLLEEEEGEELERTTVDHHRRATSRRAWKRIKRLVRVDQKADRPHTALKPGDLHGAVRSRSQTFRRDQDGACPPLRCGPFFVQRGQRPLRTLRRRRLRHGGAALPAQRVCAVPCLSWHALQRQNAGDQVPRQKHCRRAGDDSRRGLGVFCR